MAVTSYLEQLEAAIEQEAAGDEIVALMIWAAKEADLTDEDDLSVHRQIAACYTHMLTWGEDATFEEHYREIADNLRAAAHGR